MEKVGTKTQLSPSNQEYGYLEYNLQMCLNSVTAKITNAFAINNPHQSTLFERNCRDLLTVNCWIGCDELVGVNTEDEVVKRGFQFANGGVSGKKVSVGKLQQATCKKLMFCKVAIGRAYVAQEEQMEQLELPLGYHSFHLKNTRGEGQNDTYFIKNAQQILPQFILSFEFDLNKEKKSREKPKCDNCEIENATVYCSADSANLCNKCDLKMHESKLASRHQRTPIGQGSDIFGNCRHHPDKLIEFFCAQCHIPVCVYCKMVGNHANGDAAKHQLVSVSEAYHTILQEAETLDPLLQNRRNEINNQIAAIRSRGKAVEKMFGELQQQIDAIHKRASMQLKESISQKMNVLLGDELELKRQVSEIDRLDEFVKYQKQGDATSFLFNWSRHQLLKSELHDFRHFRNDIDVNLDLKIQGAVSIATDGVVNGSPKKAKPVVTQEEPEVAPEPQYPRIKTERKMQRRTSDFFAETLGAFDQFSLSHDLTEYNPGPRAIPRNA